MAGIRHTLEVGRGRLAALGAAAIALAMSGCGWQNALPDMGAVPDFHLVSQRGDDFAGTSLRGKVWVANFIFTTCHGPCPRMTSQMRKLQGDVKDMADVHLVSFTVDPDNDTPSALAAYARQFGANEERWHFLTGPQAELQKLSKDTFHLGDVGVKPVEHSSRMVLVDQQARIRGYYDSSDPEAMKQLPADIASLSRQGR